MTRPHRLASALYEALSDNSPETIQTLGAALQQFKAARGARYRHLPPLTRELFDAMTEACESCGWLAATITDEEN